MKGDAMSGGKVFPSDSVVAVLAKHAEVDLEFDSAENVAAVFRHARLRGFRGLSSVLPDRTKVGFSPEQGKMYYVKYDCDGFETSCRWDHPNSEECKIEMSEKRKAKEKLERLQSEQDAQFRDEDDETMKHRLEVAKKRFKGQASLFYKSLYGSPEMEDVQIDVLGQSLSYWLVSPAEIQACASTQFGINLAQEPQLAWVIRLFLATDLPAHWEMQVGSRQSPTLLERVSKYEKMDFDQLVLRTEKEAGSREPHRYIHKSAFPVAGTETFHFDKHPGLDYFQSLIRVLREETGLLEAQNPPATSKEGETLDVRPDVFFHFASQTFFVYDFQSSCTRVKDLPVVEISTVPPCLSDHLGIISPDENAGSSAARKEQSSESSNLVTFTPDDLNYVLSCGSLHSIYGALAAYIPLPELQQICRECRVQLKGEETEFLREIAFALLSPLPQGWERRRDPDGVVHYCNLSPTPVPDLWKHLDRPGSSSLDLPQWALKAHSRGLKVDLWVTQASKLHPSTVYLESKIASIRSDRASKLQKERIKRRQAASEEQMVARNNIAHVGRRKPLQGLDGTTAREESGSPLQQAYSYYIGLYGQPSRLRDINIPNALHRRTPEMVYRMATHLLISTDEPELFWIPHMRLAAELAPGWVFNEFKNVFYFRDADFESRHHPSDAYFLALADAARQAPLFDYFTNKHRLLDMVDDRGITYLFDFATCEAHYGNGSGRRPLDEGEEADSPPELDLSGLLDQQNDPSASELGALSLEYFSCSNNAAFMVQSLLAGEKPLSLSSSQEENLDDTDTNDLLAHDWGDMVLPCNLEIDMAPSNNGRYEPQIKTQPKQVRKVRKDKKFEKRLSHGEKQRLKVKQVRRKTRELQKRAEELKIDTCFSPQLESYLAEPAPVGFLEGLHNQRLTKGVTKIQTLCATKPPPKCAQVNIVMEKETKMFMAKKMPKPVGSAPKSQRISRNNEVPTAANNSPIECSIGEKRQFSSSLQRDPGQTRHWYGQKPSRMGSNKPLIRNRHKTLAPLQHANRGQLEILIHKRREHGELFRSI